MDNPIVEKYVELSHGKTRYLEAGEGPPAILLHGVGYTGGADNWFLNIGPLSAQRRVLAPDFVGWGPGDRLDLEYSFAYLVDFVREFQDALRIERSHIVGHSMGGWIASLFAYESPNRVDKLVLVAAGGLATRTLASMTSFAPPALAQIRAQLETQVRAPGVDLDAIALREVRKAEIPGAAEAYARILTHMNNPLTRQRYNTARRLPMITAPTLIVWGRDDTTNSVELAYQAHELIGGSRLVLFDDCGHFVPSEVPDQFNLVVGEFLARP
ncbi:MAG: alpha/beta hydrolase family protein [Chloroflexi bacterium]|nr:alpha/beta hydrolase family protein [Chloroflexota bacterium]